MEMLKPLLVEVAEVKALSFGASYDSRMILDHAITGRENVTQINHGTVKAGYALEGATHEEDEIYYILSGHAKITLGDEVFAVVPDQVIFIPGGCFHALDNRTGAEDLKILTIWKDYRFNDGYEARMKLWGKSFKRIDEE